MRREGTTIYVPRPGSRLRRELIGGSGVVGTVQDDGKVLIDYEGNKYGASNLTTYPERVYHAHARHTWQDRGYPTVARATVDADQLIEVGSCSPATRRSC